LTDAQTFGSIAAEHKLLDARGLSYEVDPRLQFDFPAMPDPAEPATAAMSRARRNAEEARPGGNPSSHRSAVAAFDHALTAAEAAAGVPRT
jgi:hypothetical protein